MLAADTIAYKLKAKKMNKNNIKLKFIYDVTLINIRIKRKLFMEIGEKKSVSQVLKSV